MKIKQVTEVDITFDNGNRIYFDHEQDCCEHNYADFKQIDDLAYEWEFDEDLKFESCPPQWIPIWKRGLHGICTMLLFSERVL